MREKSIKTSHIMKKYILLVIISVSLSIFIMQQLNYPLSPQDQSILRDFLSKNMSDLIFDSVWESIFHYSTVFEGYADNTVPGEGGFDTFASVGAVAGIGPDGAILSTGTTISNLAQIFRYPNPTFGSPITLPFITWKQPSRFRATFAVSSVDNQVAYIVVGLDPTTNSLPFYGFKIVNGNLYGATRKTNASESTVLLQSISAATNYLVEARHYPDKHKVEFYVKNSSNIMVLKGILTTDIPDASVTNHNGLFNFSIMTTNTVDKQLASSYFEYIQKRDTY